jgi:iron complex outermembrane recepter protein
LADAIANRTKNKTEQFSPRVGLTYQPWSWLSIYGNYSESLGNANSVVDVNNNLLPPETAQQHEFGFKTAFLDNRLTTNFAYYHLTKQNVAFQVPGRSYSELIDGARSEGIEFDISGQPLEGWNLIASYAYTDTKIMDNSEQNGNRLPNAPRHAGSFWTTYDLPWQTVRGLTVGAGAYIQSDKAGDRLDTFKLPGWVRMDAMLKYQLPIANSKTSFQFNVENLLDKQYYSAAGGSLSVVPGQPRTFMGSVKVEF